MLHSAMAVIVAIMVTTMIVVVVIVVVTAIERVGSTHLMADRSRRAYCRRYFRCYQRSIECYARYILAPDCLTHSLDRRPRIYETPRPGRHIVVTHANFKVFCCPVSNHCPTKRSDLSTMLVGSTRRLALARRHPTAAQALDVNKQGG
jgi:hypothetical protein